ncbi:unnamed protein product [Orchesella dallaii]|uniref:Uncharacterized protein n=1 Tax=Orchesella dallaii TaxID=48710 RepID=A0ABP1Q151_9HEXA
MGSRELKNGFEQTETRSGRTLRSRDTGNLNFSEDTSKNQSKVKKMPLDNEKDAGTPTVEADKKIAMPSTSKPLTQDPILKDFTPVQEAYIDKLLSASNNAVSNIRVVTASAAINIPKYDSDKMTAHTFE